MLNRTGLRPAIGDLRPQPYTMKTILRISFLGLFAFMACRQSQKDQPAPDPNPKPTPDYRALGDTVVNATQTALTTALTKAVEEQGTDYAVQFCNVHAMRIADSLSQKYNCTVRRISEKYRNPADKPQSENDKAVLAAFQQNKLDGKDMDPVVKDEGNAVVYYKPILIWLPTCMKCHGDTKSDIKPSTLKLIQKYYPDDHATDFRPGDFRGAWKVRFEK